MSTIALRDLKGFLRNVEGVFDSAAMFDAMGAALLAAVRRGIELEQAPGGKKWKPLKPATIRRRKGGAAHILRDTGNLYRSITYSHGQDHARVGVDTPYARIHQYGGVIRRKAGVGILHFRRAGNGVRFVRDTDRRARYAMKAAHGPYAIGIPARPYLHNKDRTIPEEWKAALTRIFLRRLAAALRQREAR